MRPGAAPSIATLERKPFSKVLMQNPLGESYTGARGKVAYKTNAVQVYCLGLISDSTLQMHRLLS